LSSTPANLKSPSKTDCLERSFACSRCGFVRRAEAQRFRLLRIAAHFAGVADRRSPMDRRRLVAAAAGDGGAERDDVSRSIEVELLDRT